MPLLSNVVSKLVVPFRLHCTVAPCTKFEPNTNSVKLPLPSCTDFGLRSVMIGAFVESVVTVKVAGLELSVLWPVR